MKFLIGERYKKTDCCCIFEIIDLEYCKIVICGRCDKSVLNGKYRNIYIFGYGNNLIKLSNQDKPDA